MNLSKKKKQKQKFEYKKAFIHYVYCLMIIMLLLIAGNNINTFLNNQKVLGAKIDTTPLQNEKLYWENLVKKNPKYTDAYLQLAKVDIELGLKEEALDQIKTALSLDPNSNKIIEVKKLLGL